MIIIVFFLTDPKLLKLNSLFSILLSNAISPTSRSNSSNNRNLNSKAFTAAGDSFSITDRELYKFSKFDASKLDKGLVKGNISWPVLHSRQSDIWRSNIAVADNSEEIQRHNKVIIEKKGTKGTKSTAESVKRKDSSVRAKGSEESRKEVDPCSEAALLEALHSIKKSYYTLSNHNNSSSNSTSLIDRIKSELSPFFDRKTPISITKKSFVQRSVSLAPVVKSPIQRYQITVPQVLLY